MPRRKLATRETAFKSRASRTKTSGSAGNEVPDIYREMLVEVTQPGGHSLESSDPPPKKRKVNTPDASRAADLKTEADADEFFTQGRDFQTRPSEEIIYDDIAEPSDSEDVFEDVNLEPEDDASTSEGSTEQQRLRIDLSASSGKFPQKTVDRRKPISKSEQALRLSAHKWHILCLLLHLAHRNKWCDSDEVQAILKPTIPRKTLSLLHVDESHPQFQRVQSFHKAIEDICTLWKVSWQINVGGLRRAFWKEEVDLEAESEQAEEPVDFDDFRQAAMSRSGSRDLGAQLFCALLRSVAVETRLVCSLQTLPFSANAKGRTPQKLRRSYIHAPPQSFDGKSEGHQSALHSNPRWRMSDHSAAIPSRPIEGQTKKKKVKDSQHPIFWVEVFSPATTSWIPVDSLVRQTINKPKTGFEPPASDQLNAMCYVIAFEEDGSAKDVTRRYVRYPNSKTRKLRVESTKGGQKWWNHVMRHFVKFLPQDRDAIEEAELAKREAAEPMPKNIQDFKGHPIYVLERHLRRNEVIHPKRDVGKISTGPSKSAAEQLENVYRQRDVHVVRTADQWYRRGRDVIEGEVGLKRVQSKILRIQEGSGEEDDGANEGTALYAEFQTNVYVPPPAIRGRVPKNAYGNIDVYVATMIPPGTVHIQHPDATTSAKALGISFADAVTGFSFKGRQGTAIINGIVVAREFKDALVEVIERLEYDRIRQEEARRTLLVLQMWKRFVISLRVRKKVEEEYKSDGDEFDTEASASDESVSVDQGGGFFMEHDSDLSQLAAEDNLTPTLRDINSVSLPPPAVLTHHDIIITESPHDTNHPVSARTSMEETGSQPDCCVDLPRGEEAGSPREPGGFLIDHESQVDVTPQEATTPIVSVVKSKDGTGAGLVVKEETDQLSGDDLQTQVKITSQYHQPTDHDSPQPHDDSILADEAVDETSSLLSHDPDDEDAEGDMDWLMDD